MRRIDLAWLGVARVVHARQICSGAKSAYASVYSGVNLAGVLSASWPIGGGQIVGSLPSKRDTALLSTFLAGVVFSEICSDSSHKGVLTYYGPG